MLSDIPAFVAAVEAGGFAAASRELGLSRSAVGKAVARLEAQLGVRLVQRSTRSQSLTEDGQAFFERCQQALDQVRVGTALLESGRGIPRGKLRASMPVLFGRLRVAPILMRLAGLHPELSLDLSFNDRHVDLVEDGFDLAIRNGPLRSSPNLMSRLLARQQTRLYAAPSYLAARGAPASLEALADHHAVVYCRSGRLHPWRFPCADGTVRDCTPPSRLRFDDLGTIADAAIAGLGLAWLPDWLAEQPITTGALAEVLPSVTPLVTEIYAVWPEAPYLPAKVRISVDALAGGLGVRTV